MRLRKISMKKAAVILCAVVVGFVAVGCSADKSGDTQQMPASGPKKDPNAAPGLPPQAQDAIKKQKGG
jgi:hypothetical protein